MNVLLVDDDRQKIKAVIEHLVANCGIARESIDVAQTGASARSFLSKQRYDVLVLDVLLPLRDENEPDARTSLDLLEDIDQDRGVFRPGHIIGLSAVETLPSNVVSAFRDRTWTIVHYDVVTTGWQGPLSNSMLYLSKQSNVSDRPVYGADVCILAALPVPEMEQIHRLRWNWQDEAPLDDHTFVRRGTVRSGERDFSVVSAHAPRMGMVATSLLAAKLIREIRPRFIVMPGICAGVIGKAEVGDVILADIGWNWQSGKHAVDDLGPHFSAAPHMLAIPEFIRSRGVALRADRSFFASVKQNFNGTRPPHELQLKIGPVASGSAVLADEAVIREIQKHERSLVGVEMEIYGMYAAAAFASYPRPTAFALKAVCDFGTQGKNDEHQAYAAYTSAEVLREFLERYLHELQPLAGS